MKATDFGNIINATKTAMESHLADELGKYNIGAIFFPRNGEHIYTSIDDSVEGHLYIEVLGFKKVKYGILLCTERDIDRLENEDKDNIVKVSERYLTLNPEDAEKYDELFDTPIEDSLDPTELLLSLIREYECLKIDERKEESQFLPDYIPFIPMDKNGCHLNIGDKVKWIDPAVADYETEEEYLEAINRVFEIFDIDEDTEFISISNGHSEAEVFDHELIKVVEE